MGNSINTSDNVEVYENKIFQYADEYVNSLPDPNMIYKTSCFDGMIDYIYVHLFRPYKGQKVLNNTKSNLDLSNIGLLDDIFYIYKSLCHRYNKRVTILRFCCLIGISNQTVNTWVNGEYRNNTTMTHSQTVKKWFADCESDLLNGAIEENSVGCIFALKANYGYTEAPQQIQVVGDSIKSREQIALEFKGATMPDLPQFDD